MTRKDLAKAIAKNAKLNARQAENLIIAFGAVVGEALSKEDKVVYSNFGTFYTVHYPSKVIYHPRLGKEKKMVMLPTNAVKWMPSGNIKDMVNTGIQVENATVHGKKKIKNDNPQKSPFETSLIPDTNATISGDKKEAARLKSLDNKKNNESEAEEVDVPIKVTKKTASPIPEPILDNSKDLKDSSTEELKHVNIYEELMEDGSKIESTFPDAIRVHKSKTRSFIDRFIGKKNQDSATSQTETIEKPSSASHLGAGVFDINQNKQTIPETPEKKPLAEKPLEDKPLHDLNPSKQADNKSESGGKGFEYFLGPLASDPKTAETASSSKESIITPFATKTNVCYVDLLKTTVAKEVLQKIPEKIARQNKIVPVSEDEKELVVAMIDPEDIETREMIKKLVGKNISVRLATEADINHILDQYSGLESELKEAIETVDEESEDDKTKVDKNALIESASDNAPAARIVSSLLHRAIRDKASDVHIEPSEKEVEVRFRVDGILKKKVSLPKDIQSAVVSRIKILCNMKIDEQRLPQDGRFSIAFDNRKIDFRVSTMPVSYGEKVVMRVLDKVSSILTIEQLGIRGSGLDAFNKNIKKSHGMVLVTGPTGSGKTTTLYALIDRIYSEGVNIVTLEDPIEYRMPGINQSQVNAEINYTFASGLRSIVRQDPDVIMIGEIRDGETAEMAIHAALTGHVVLSTLHTNNSAGAAPRLIDMGVEPFLLTSSLNCVIGQRLARKICDDCKEEVKITREEAKEVVAEIAKMPKAEQEEANKKKLKFFKGKGCKNCADTGYHSRVGLYEILDITETIKELILKKESSYKIEEEAVRAGMVTMVQDGILKALDGITTLEEVWRITKE